jgi:hypothetical protein
MAVGGNAFGSPTSQPFGNATSFSGIPWTVSNPTYDPAPFGFSSGLANSISGFNTSNGQSPTMANPQATGYANQVEGIAGQLGASGGNAVSAANATASNVGGLASQLQGLGTGLTTAFSNDLPYAQQALTDAFDPMKTEQNYYLNQAQSAAGAASAQSGVAGTPYGAEVQGATTASFNNAWQTAQVGREATGAATATALQNQYESGVVAGGALINQAGQLDLGALSGQLQAYGLQGSNLAAAGQMIQGLLSSLNESLSNSNGATLTG